MKTTTLVLGTIAMALTLAFSPVMAQQKLKNKDLKAPKRAKKEAKSLQKKGWEVAPGSLPMEKLLEKSFTMQLEGDDKGSSKYIHADGNAVAQTKMAADQQAYSDAKIKLAGQLETRVNTAVKTSVANEQLSVEDAASITKVITASKDFIIVKLGRIEPVFKAYRPVGNKNIEVQMKIFYNLEGGMSIVKEKIKEELNEEIDDLHNILDDVLDLD